MHSSLTNIHIHVFNIDCAPKRLLMILPQKFVRKNAVLIRRLLDSKGGRKTIQFMFRLFAKKEAKSRTELDKIIAFLNVGTSVSQLQVFETALDAGRRYDAEVKIVALTLNMDYMDSEPSNHKKIDTQLEEVKDIKRYYPNHFYPFLCVDPRHKSADALLNWVKGYTEYGFEKGGKLHTYFSGIKLYPALGFFPFDKKLAETFAYAERYGLPIMTHCTRVGSQYVGDNIESLMPRAPFKPDMILPNIQSDYCKKSIEELLARIERFYAAGKVKNSKIGSNDDACDLFSHPQNYINLLEKFPNLKICLAHMGGTSEFFMEDELKDNNYEDYLEVRKLDGYSWFHLIKEMMIIYPNLYTDISYTLSDFHKKDVLKYFVEFLNTKDNSGRFLGKRVLFGTDFFMTEQEQRERELYDDFLGRAELIDWIPDITKNNANNFLRF